ncbi:serine hydrolase [Halocola ammonii]
MRIIFAILISLSISFIGRTQKEFASQVEELIEQYQEVYGFSGTVKIVANNSPLLDKSYGLASRSFQVHNTPETRFSINSISKTFTAVAILQLAEQNLIDLHKPIGEYLPNLETSWKDSVTTHHLLTHSSGLPRESGIQWYDEKSLWEQAKMVEKQELLFNPGSRYEYSNSGIILLGAILEEVSGEEYHDYIDEHIISPLKLPNTGVYQGRRVVENQATPYRFTPNGMEEAQRSKHLGENAGGGLYSTPSDLYDFVIALEEHKLLSESSTDLLFDCHIKTSDGECEGYCWSIKSFGADKIRFAAGSGYGTKSVIIRSPESGLFIGIVSNLGTFPILNLLRDLYLTVKGEQVEPPSSKNLAKPNDYRARLGVYHFDPEVLKKHLMIDKSQIKLHSFEGKLFLDDELLVQQPSGKLTLTYTNELTIDFEDDKMVIEINGNRIVSE